MDYVEYLLYPPKDILDLQDFCQECYLVLAPFLRDFLWHYEGFTLTIADGHLSGKLHFGDNIEDEWFVVSLLLRLTEKMPEVVVRVTDNDGEFLLIEAADVLPKWAQEPQLTENRVYLYRGSVHLIPQATKPSELTPHPAGTPEIKDAVNTIRNFSSVTLASEKVNEAIKRRLKKYPDDYSELFHSAHVVIPPSLAVILNRRPDLITPAINAFCSRDQIDQRVLRLMKNFRPDSLVKRKIKFPKSLYAMLDSQKFRPDKKSGWEVPLPGDDSKAKSLGMKLTCGFEILLSQHRSESSNNLNENDPNFKKFIQSLDDRSYFRGLLPGSKDYQALIQQAKQFFLNSVSLEDFQNRYSKEVYELFHSINESDLEPIINCTTLEPEDDDSWMEMDPETFDNFLSKQFKLEKSGGNEKEIPKQLEGFLQQISGLEGVEVPGSSDEKVDFKPGEFESAVKKMLGLSNESDDSDSDEGSEDPEMKSYMDALDSELSGTKVEPIIEKKLVSSTEELEEELNKPLDIDLTVLKNLMESYSSQGGEVGPAATLLNPLLQNNPNESQ